MHLTKIGHVAAGDWINVHTEILERKIVPGCEAKFCFVRVVGGQRCNIHIFLLLTLICAKNEQIISKI